MPCFYASLKYSVEFIWVIGYYIWEIGFIILSCSMTKAEDSFHKIVTVLSRKSFWSHVWIFLKEDPNLTLYR